MISSQIPVRWRWPRRRPPGVLLRRWYPDYMLSWHGGSPTQTHIYLMMYMLTPARQVLYADFILHCVNRVLGIQTSNLKFPPVWIKKCRVRRSLTSDLRDNGWFIKNKVSWVVIHLTSIILILHLEINASF